jgi:hypothetical protein
VLLQGQDDTQRKHVDPMVVIHYNTLTCTGQGVWYEDRVLWRHPHGGLTVDEIAVELATADLVILSRRPHELRRVVRKQAGAAAVRSYCPAVLLYRVTSIVPKLFIFTQ